MDDWNFEKVRVLLEQSCRLEAALADYLKVSPKSFTEKLVQEHRAQERLLQLQNYSKLAEAVFTNKLLDKDAVHEKGSSLIQSLDAELKKLEVLHVKRGDSQDPVDSSKVTIDVSPAALDAEIKRISLLFSGEEFYGKYIDMHELHGQYLALKAVPTLSYAEYLAKVSDFSLIPPKTQQSAQFASYVLGLDDYLTSFIARSRPLFFVDEKRDKWKQQFLSHSSEGGKSRYCYACSKEFSNLNVYNAHIQSKKHFNRVDALEKRRGNKMTPELLDDLANDYKEQKNCVEMHKFIFGNLYKELSDIFEKTQANVERKQSLTEREWLEEPDQFNNFSESEAESEDRLDNPLKLPLGWDGKPIPYWLYRLHGLSKEYECEICGNYVYRGRLAFDRHFQEARHIHGFQCLGIPNLKIFHDITSIAELKETWIEWSNRSKQQTFNPEAMEECEDNEGNVFSKKTYLDLKSQGLL